MNHGFQQMWVEIKNLWNHVMVKKEQTKSQDVTLHETLPC